MHLGEEGEDMIIITEEELERFQRLGACQQGLAWARGRTRMECVERYGMWMLLTEEVRYALAPWVIDACAERELWAALECAAQLLTPERLDACAEREPWAALRHAAPLLSPERLVECRRAVG